MQEPDIFIPDGVGSILCIFLYSLSMPGKGMETV